MISTVVCDKNLDSQLWASFQKGESKALDTLYKRYYSSLLAYGYHYCGERELAADCIHDFFLYIWERRESLGQVHSLRFYLMSSFRRRLHKYLERRRRMDHQQKSHANLNNLHEHAHSTESRLIQAEEEANRCHLLQNLIDQLPGRQKQIVHLRYYQGLTPSEISHTLGIHYQTVVNHLTTAFKSFREHKVTIRHRLD